MRRAINYAPARPSAILLAVLPFALILVIYAIGSDVRLAANPTDKLMPSFGGIGEAVGRLACRYFLCRPVLGNSYTLLALSRWP